MNNNIRQVFLLLLLILAPITVVKGKVFWKRQAAEAGSPFDKTGRWQCFYRCKMAINGKPASLAVYKCGFPPTAVASSLNNTKDTSEFEVVFQGNNSILCSSKADKRLARLLLLGMPFKNESIIFELIQPLSDNPPPASAAGPIPEESIPTACSRTHTIVNADTGTTLESFTTDLPPHQAFNLLANYLIGQDWQALLPDANYDSAKQCFGVFMRKKNLCLLTTGCTLHENKTCVTIISKETNIK